jgi:hypothetical protein
MSKTTDTTRRSFLKAGALAAAPVAAIGIPVAAMAEDGSKAALARLQDERAIEKLNRDFLRAFNGGGAEGTAQLFVNRKAPAFAKGVNKLVSTRPKRLKTLLSPTMAPVRWRDSTAWLK